MKKFLKWFAGIVVVLVIIYFSGPRPSRAVGTKYDVLPADLSLLEKTIDNSEKAVRGLKPDNQARIVWADTSRKEKTDVVFLYLHGFSACQAEGAPVHTAIATRFSSNLYLSRLEGHGIDRGDSTMIDLTSTAYLASAERALEIASRLGNNVIIIGTSAGGALTLYLASEHPEIKAILLYSPCVKLFDKTAVILDKPWGLQLARAVTGSAVKHFPAESAVHAQYWQLTYRIEALVALEDLVNHTMKKQVFSKITCPVFLGYYYKNEREQDSTVSVPAMLKMFNELGTHDSLKVSKAFPVAGAHVIASNIRSKDWMSVQDESIRFLEQVVRLK